MRSCSPLLLPSVVASNPSRDLSLLERQLLLAVSRPERKLTRGNGKETVIIPSIQPSSARILGLLSSSCALTGYFSNCCGSTSTQSSAPIFLASLSVFGQRYPEKRKMNLQKWLVQMESTRSRINHHQQQQKQQTTKQQTPKTKKQTKTNSFFH